MFASRTNVNLQGLSVLLDTLPAFFYKKKDHPKVAQYRVERMSPYM
jgi:hypothetical protein